VPDDPGSHRDDVTPVSTSTNGWTTTAGQTTHGNNAQRVAFNNWLRDGAPIDGAGAPLAVGATGTRAGQPGHPLAGYFETADTMETARNSGIWKMPTTPRTAPTRAPPPTPRWLPRSTWRR
jgi:hypothetical protein